MNSNRNGLTTDTVVHIVVDDSDNDTPTQNSNAHTRQNGRNQQSKQNGQNKSNGLNVDFDVVVDSTNTNANGQTWQEIK